MKRLLLFIFVLVIIVILAPGAFAAENDLFSEERQLLESGLSDEAKEGMAALGADSIEEIIASGVDGEAVWRYISGMIGKEMKTPLSSFVVLIAAVILCSVAEGYTYSLRYTETSDIMGAAVSLFTASAVISPIMGLLGDSVTVIRGGSSILLIYLPIMAGMLAFSGHTVSSAGYYAAVSGMCGAVGWLASGILMPLLNMLLSLSVCSGISRRINLRGLTSALTNAFKWLLTFAMSVFAAVIGLNGALSSAADGIADKAAKFTLSSLIPFVGASVSDAYSAVRGSVGVLRSGMGVFVILSVCVSILPVLFRCVLWSALIYFSKLTADALSVGSASSMLNTLSSFLSAVRALLICVSVAFILSSAVMMRIGGSI